MNILRPLAVVTAANVAAAVAPPVATAQSPCRAPWFISAQQEAAAGERRLLLFRRGYTEGDTLVVGIRMAASGADSVKLVVGDIGSGSWVTLVDRWIPTLAPSLVSNFAEECYVRGTLWLDASVVDLDADGQREIVAQYNRAGACAKCFSEVTVLAWADGRYRVALESAYAVAAFAPGEGLTLQVPEASPEGDLRLVEKKFFEKRL